VSPSPLVSSQFPTEKPVALLPTRAPIPTPKYSAPIPRTRYPTPRPTNGIQTLADLLALKNVTLSPTLNPSQSITVNPTGVVAEIAPTFRPSPLPPTQEPTIKVFTDLLGIGNSNGDRNQTYQNMGSFFLLLKF